MKAPYLLFDFDGTIADSITPLFHMLNKMAPEIGVRPVSWEEFDRLRDLTPRQILKELKIPLFKMPRLVRMVLEEYRHIISHLQPCEGILELLSELKQRQISHALLSSNDDQNLSAFLAKYRIDSFAWVEGTEGVLNKSSYLRKQIRKHKLAQYDLYYIGDEIRDIEAARSNKIKSIAVSWGLHSHQHLQKQQPDYLVDKPSEILNIMKQPHK
ncbi:MAG TPA: HAD hydrolase-like protein [Candidatus Cloacimonetes bacterium]|jgi:phosphoglycolate phosphatase|nr:HAD hydrolase-like protein [Candidatus Cloacimonadota bacterium]